MNLPSIPSHLCTSHSAAPGNKQSARQDDVTTRERWGGLAGTVGRTLNSSDVLLWPLCWGRRSGTPPCRTLDRTCLGSSSGTSRGCWASGSAAGRRLTTEPVGTKKRFVLTAPHLHTTSCPLQNIKRFTGLHYRGLSVRLFQLVLEEFH